MSRAILIISGSPHKSGNTSFLIKWFSEGAVAAGAHIDLVHAAGLKHKAVGCTSCRACQANAAYQCVIQDEVSDCLARFLSAEVIVMASPLYFYGASSQLKMVMDRMFSLYKWDNAANTMTTPLKGKRFVFLGSGYEDAGFDVFEKPFQLTAAYTKMRYDSFLVKNAGVSGDIVKLPGVKDRVVAFGKKMTV